MIFFLFFPETGFDIPCILSPLETICRKCQNLFSGTVTKKKNISMCTKYLPSMLLSFHITVYNLSVMLRWYLDVTEGADALLQSNLCCAAVSPPPPPAWYSVLAVLQAKAQLCNLMCIFTPKSRKHPNRTIIL